MMTLIGTAILAYIYLAQPFADKSINRMEVINETLVWFNTYFLLAYNDILVEAHRSIHVEDKVCAMETLYKYGWCNIAGIALILVVNVTVLVYSTIKTLIMQCKCIKKKCQKSITVKAPSTEPL